MRGGHGATEHRWWFASALLACSWLLATQVHAQQPPPEQAEEQQPEEPEPADDEAQPAPPAETQPAAREAAEEELDLSVEPLEDDQPAEEAPAEAEAAATPPAPSEEDDVFEDPGVTATRAQPVEGQEAVTSEEIVITGSRIKRSGFASSSPVQVLDREQIEESGASDMRELIRYIAVNAQPEASGNLSGSQGTAQFNLRGLGPSATLVLINGRRLLKTGQGVDVNFSDVNIIPLAMIERVEILRGGASAIYGSDAVAGVVNIITRHEFDGVRVEAATITSTKFDHGDHDVSVAAGATTMRSALAVGVNFNKRTRIETTERDWADGNYEVQLGQPGNYIPQPIGVPMPDPQCEQAPNAALRDWNIGTEDMPNIIQGCFWEYSEQHDLLPEVNRLNGLATASFDFTDHLELFGELHLARSRTNRREPASFPLLQRPVVPADHFANPFTNAMGQPISVGALGSPLGIDQPPTITRGDSDTARVVAGFRGDFEDAAEDTLAEDWEWELVGSWGGNRFRTVTPDTIDERIQQALDSCSDPDMLEDCFNPFYSSVLGMDAAGNPVPPNGPEVIDRIRGKLIAIVDSALWTADAGLSGSLLELAGGDLGFAFGAQYRRETRRADLDSVQNERGFSFLFGNSDNYNDRDIYATYLELALPIFMGFELQGAVRFEDYSDVGSRTTPRAGVIWSPFEVMDAPPQALARLRLRGAFATSFRAPDLFQVEEGGFATFFATIPPGTVVPVIGRGNPELGPEKSIAVSGGIDWAPIDQLNLEADVWSYNYDDIIVSENAVELYTSFEETGVQDCVLLRQGREDCIDLQNDMFMGAPSVTRVNTTRHNAAQLRNLGADFFVLLRLSMADFDSTAEIGTFALGAQGSYIFTQKLQVAEDGEEIETAGNRNQQNPAVALPKLRLNVPLSWSMDGHSIILLTHYIDSFEDDGVDQVTGEEIGTEVAAQTTFDLQYSYRVEDWIGDALTLRFGLINLLDEDPPEAVGLGGATTVHDPRGRLAYVRASMQF